MISLHPEILRKNGKEEFVVLPYEEYVAICELLEDAQDLMDLNEAKQKEGSAPTIPLDEVKRRLGIE